MVTYQKGDKIIMDASEVSKTVEQVNQKNVTSSSFKIWRTTDSSV